MNDLMDEILKLILKDERVLKMKWYQFALLLPLTALVQDWPGLLELVLAAGLIGVGGAAATERPQTPLSLGAAAMFLGLGGWLIAASVAG